MYFLSFSLMEVLSSVGARPAATTSPMNGMVILPSGRIISGGGGTALLNVFQVDVTNFVNQFVVGYLAPVLAAWLVLRGVVEISEGRSPLYSILGAMFLLSIASTQALLQGWNSGTKFATADVLAGLWTYTASRILPVAAGLAIIGAILNFAFGKPAMRLICCAAGFLTVSALWRLVVSMM